jgi:hypothetical protein
MTAKNKLMRLMKRSVFNDVRIDIYSSGFLEGNLDKETLKKILKEHNWTQQEWNTEIRIHQKRSYKESEERYESMIRQKEERQKNVSPALQRARDQLKLDSARLKLSKFITSAVK